MKVTLRDFIEVVSVAADEIFAKHGELVGIWHMIDTQGVCRMIDAADMGDLVEAYIHKYDIVRYVFIDQAWTVQRPDDFTDQFKKHGLKHEPDKERVVLICGEDQTEGFIMAVRKVLQASNGKPYLGKLHYVDKAVTNSVGCGLLPAKGPMQ